MLGLFRRRRRGVTPAKGRFGELRRQEGCSESEGVGWDGSGFGWSRRPVTERLPCLRSKAVISIAFNN